MSAAVAAQDAPCPHAGSDFYIKLSEEKYKHDIRWQRFDVGRLLCQQRVNASALKNAKFTIPVFVLPRSWWSSWCAYVGGFSESADVAALVSASSKTPLAELTPDSDVILRAFSTAGLLSALPNSARPFVPKMPSPTSVCTVHYVGSQNGDADDEGFEVSEEILCAFKHWYGCQATPLPKPAYLTLASIVAPIASASQLSPLSSPGAAPSPIAAATQRPCCVCGYSGGLICATCKKPSYCDKFCQRLDWDKHKADCKKIAGGAACPPHVIRDRRNGLVGLDNIGNTCYMGSALQALAAVWPLSRYYIRGEYEAEVNMANKLGTRGAMSVAYADLLRGLWLGSATSFQPRKMLARAAEFQEMFQDLAQQDSHELLSYVLDGLHEDCNKAAGGVKQQLRDQAPGESDVAYGDVSWRFHRSNNDSRIVDLFGGQFKSTLSCPSCAARSVHFDYFNMIQLPMPDVMFKNVSIVLRRLQPGLTTREEAFVLPTGDAPSAVRAVWDGIAEHAEPLLERVVVRLNTSGGRAVPADEILEALSSKCGISPDRLFLHRASSSPASGNFGSVDLFFPSGASLSHASVMALTKYSLGTSVDQSDSATALFATEVFPPGWHSPLSSADEAAAVQSAEAEAMAFRVIGKVGTHDPLHEKTWNNVKRTRLPGRRSLLVVRFLEPKLFSENDMPPPSPKAGEKMTFDGDRSSFTIVVPVALDMPLAVVRMHIAAAILPLVSRKFRSLIVPSSDGNEPGHVLLRSLAAMLPVANERFVILPSFSQNLSSSNQPSTRLGAFVDLAMFNKDDGSFSPDSVWSRVHVKLHPVMPQLLHAASSFERAIVEHVGNKGLPDDAAAADIITCFRQSLSERLDDNIMWDCPGCKKNVTARKSDELWRLPEFLIVSFKRFKSASSDGQYRARKATQFIDFPLSGLNLSEINSGARASAAQGGTPAPESLYDCIAVVNQIGQLRGGHCEENGV